MAVMTRCGCIDKSQTLTVAPPAADTPNQRARPELDDSPRQREQLQRAGSSSGVYLPPDSPSRNVHRTAGIQAAVAAACGSPPTMRARLVSHSSVPAPLLPRASLSAGMIPRPAPAPQSLARAREAVMADLASNPPPSRRQRGQLDSPVSSVVQSLPQASPSASAAVSQLQRTTSLPASYMSAQSARAGLRRDSPMDPLVEARRVVLKDLADHPVKAGDSSATPGSSARRPSDSYPDTPPHWQVWFVSVSCAHDAPLL